MPCPSRETISQALDTELRDLIEQCAKVADERAIKLRAKAKSGTGLFRPLVA
jgi:hypothetical protein